MSRLTVLACVLAAACSSPPDPTVLLDADRAFDAAVARDGAAAWAAWFADDGAMVQEGVGEIRGRDAIGRAAAYLDRSDLSLRWEPERADIASSGDLGWTTGHYVLTVTAPDGGESRSQGRYVSIWRRQPDGEWKVVMDLGNPVDAPAR